MGSWCFLWDSSSSKTFFSSPSQLHICCHKTRHLSELQNVNFLHKAKPVNQIFCSMKMRKLLQYLHLLCTKLATKLKTLSRRLYVHINLTHGVQIFPKYVWFCKIVCSPKLFFSICQYFYMIYDISQLWHLSTKLVTPLPLSISLSLDTSTF